MKSANELRASMLAASWLLPLLLFASGSAHAALVSSLDTQARTTIVWNNVSQDADADTTEPAGTASSSASGSGFTGAAQAFVDASDFGHLKLSGSASMSVNSSIGQSTAFSQLVIQDEWLLSNAALTGQAGVASVSLLVTGSWESLGAWGQVGTRVEFATLAPGSATPALNLAGQLAALGNRTIESCNNLGTAAQCLGLFTFDVPFVFGDELGIRYIASGSAVVSPGNFVGIPRSGSVTFDRANSIYWGGISRVTVGGQAVSDYSFATGSGYDWRASRIPTAGTVPEPSTVALLATGIAGIAAIRRRRQEPLPA